MPGVHRDGDSRTCGATTEVSLQSSVYVNNKLCAVQGDTNSHGNGNLDASINPGTVFIGGIEVVVDGSTARPDDLCEVIGGNHCSPTAAEGSSDVFLFEQ